MILNIDNTAKAGKPCRVFDARGTEVNGVVWCDIETGEVEVLDIEKSKESGWMHHRREVRESPLQVVWVKHGQA